MKSWIPILAVLALSSGCSSIATLSAFHRPHQFDADGWKVTRVYSGVSNDIRFLKGGGEGSFIALVDLPFSFVLDTLVLPYSIYAQIKDGHLSDGEVQAATDAGPE